ncbi:alkylhydroperoxidase family enzyme [Kribbella orskensis]|uniref:Alkylhydroperoxidase family enzyme n=1 Tax=Kribbella orskensis TaxID=2512216 RepID=A0ABY2B7N1_9ACTN|nr:MULTISPECIES: carboxymuconolactone decarboxylase family protein [Kribbella]TCN30464.1 alkylhydroperoxidase family enzyme [Kribbella sp. VKM Ac-2500]TCO11106.1 alkylhydroperoxidase family enzyme [Kribbella orskensis]
MARIGMEHRRTVFVRVLEWWSRKKYGEVLDPVKVALHNRRVLASTVLLEGTAARWNKLDPTLRALAGMVASAQVGCSWCMDFGYWEYHHQGIDPAKLRAVPRWRDSDVYTDLERAVMEYAEAMTATPPEVTDEQVERLRRDLNDAELVELTTQVSLENFRSRTNSALGMTSQGFKRYCELRPA